MYTLYGSRGSGSAAVEIALRVCGLAYRQVRASSWEADSAIEELELVNPLRQIPTLVLPDGSVMTESAAILIHLGLTFPQSMLLPEVANSAANAAANAKAQAIRGLVFIAANCYSAIGIIDYPQRWTTATDEPEREAVRQGARDRLHNNWEIFADTFPANLYLGGSAPGALDFLAAVVSNWAGTRAHLAQHRPSFLEVMQRVEAHEAVAPIFREHWET